MQRWHLFLVSVLAVALAAYGGIAAAQEDAPPDAAAGPTEEGLQATAQAYADTFNDRDWMALYALEPAEFQEHCDPMEYAFALEFAVVIAEGFLASEFGAEEDVQLQARVSGVQVEGSDGYVDVDILLGETLLESDVQDPETDAPGWVYQGGEWQRNITDWDPEEGCAMGFFDEDEEDDQDESPSSQPGPAPTP